LSVVSSGQWWLEIGASNFMPLARLPSGLITDY
jgi:hypothetical protein